MEGHAGPEVLESSGSACRQAGVALAKLSRLIANNSGGRSAGMRLRVVVPIAALLVAGVSLALFAQATGQQTKGKDEKLSTADLTGVWSQNMPASARAYDNFTFFKDEPPMTPGAGGKYKAG